MNDEEEKKNTHSRAKKKKDKRLALFALQGVSPSFCFRLPACLCV